MYTIKDYNLRNDNILLLTRHYQTVRMSQPTINLPPNARREKATEISLHSWYSWYLTHLLFHSCCVKEIPLFAFQCWVDNTCLYVEKCQLCETSICHQKTHEVEFFLSTRAIDKWCKHRYTCIFLRGETSSLTVRGDGLSRVDRVP